MLVFSRVATPPVLRCPGPVVGGRAGAGRREGAAGAAAPSCGRGRGLAGAAAAPPRPQWHRGTAGPGSESPARPPAGGGGLPGGDLTPWSRRNERGPLRPGLASAPGPAR